MNYCNWCYLCWVVIWLCCGCSATVPPQTDGRTLSMYSDSVRQYLAFETTSYALLGATVIDGSGEGVQYNQTIVVENGVIEKLGPLAEVDVPAGFTRYDVQGETIIPGLVGTHNHLRFPQGALFYSGPRLYLAGGVTTIQTCGTGHVAEELVLARLIREGEVVGPDIVNSGPYFTGPSGKNNFIRFTDPDQIADTIQQLAGAGVKWLKVYRSTRPSDLAYIVEKAHEHGLKVTGHLCATTYVEAVEAGIDAIEHGFIHSFDHAEGKPPGECGGDRSFRSELAILGTEVQEVQAALIKAGVALSTTPAILEAQTPGRAQAKPEALTLLALWHRNAYAERQTRMQEAGTDWYFGTDWLERSLEYDLTFYRRGGLLTAGPDPGLHVLSGFGDQRNYQLLVEAGFEPWEAVQVLTSNGAQLLGRQEIGTIAEGKRADLVVLDGNLHEDSAAIEKVRWVIKKGLAFDPVLLRKGLEGLVGSEFDGQYRYEP